MAQSRTLQIAEPDSKTRSDATESISDVPAANIPSIYDQADAIKLRDYAGSYSFPKFINAVLNELGKDSAAESARLVDSIDDPEDVHFGLLLAFPDESLMFVGSDPTAKDAIPWFCCTIERHEPIPAPESAQAALDRLKTPEVRDVEAEDGFLAPRHGEWWLLPTDLIPAGSVFTPGVSSRPYGPSPLGNHVPREYAFTVSDDDFMARFRDRTAAPDTIATPAEAIEWTQRQLNKQPTPGAVPTWGEIREMAGDILVRGTIRHRENDHYVENIGEVWHKAQTHDVEVYTGDEMATRVHLDYHGTDF